MQSSVIQHVSILNTIWMLSSSKVRSGIVMRSGYGSPQQVLF